MSRIIPKIGTIFRNVSHLGYTIIFTTGEISACPEISDTSVVTVKAEYSANSESSARSESGIKSQKLSQVRERRISNNPDKLGDPTLA